MRENEPDRLPENCVVVACGILRRELRHLVETGFVDGHRVLFTSPGLHEWPERLKRQLTRQLGKARAVAERVIVAYGEKCYFDTDTGKDTDGLLAEVAPGAVRVSAKNCVDMLADERERNRLAGGEKVYWLTPGWVEHWDFIFKDWDAAKANETFPANDKGIVLDGVGYFEELSRTNPEKVLRICDWAKLPLEPHCTSLRRLTYLLRECAQTATEGSGSGSAAESRRKRG